MGDHTDGTSARHLRLPRARGGGRSSTLPTSARKTLHRLRGLEGALRGDESDLLHPVEPVESAIKALRHQRAGPGLASGQYTHVLFTFTHASCPNLPELRLAKFHAPHATGLEAFTKKHDPYWDIPLNEDLPQPVIDIPIRSEPMASEQGGLFTGKGSGAGTQGPRPSAEKRRGRKRSSQHG
jgi:hypothetical protein